jgi:hypothetical protein
MSDRSIPAGTSPACDTEGTPEPPAAAAGLISMADDVPNPAGSGTDNDTAGTGAASATCTEGTPEPLAPGAVLSWMAETSNPAAVDSGGSPAAAAASAASTSEAAASSESQTIDIEHFATDSAMMIAYERALESERGEGALFNDPYARPLAGTKGEGLSLAFEASAPHFGFGGWPEFHKTWTVRFGTAIKGALPSLA